MAIGDEDGIDRVARRVREQPEPGWQAIEETVIAAVRATPRAGWPLQVEDPHTEALGRLRVTDLVVSAQISRALAGDPDYIVTDIDVVFDHDLLQAVSVTLSGRYESDLVASTRRVRAAVDAVLDDVVGGHPDVTVAVNVGDVHR